ncbi:MAG: hypothetical protein AAF738_06920, partial [Bacteroidota bacterium]
MRSIYVLFALFFSYSQLFAQQRDTITEAYRVLVAKQALAEASDGHHHHGYFEGTEVTEVEVVSAETVDVYLSISNKVASILDEHAIEEYVVVLHYLMEQLDYRVRNIYAKTLLSTYLPISSFVQKDEGEAAVYETPKNDDPFPDIIGTDREALQKNPSRIGQGQPTGALSGKTVWLSPGHGWIYFSSLGGYSTQRGNTNDVVEDFGTIEAVGYYLLQYLWNAGANVWMVRERDFNTQEIIVDNDSPASGYSDTGTWGTSGTPGYNGGTYRFANTTATATATAVYAPNITEAGWYWVSVYFREGPNRPVDAR